MSEPHRNLVFDAALAALATISVANGYFTDFAQAPLDRTIGPIASPIAYPAVGLHDLGEESWDEPGRGSIGRNTQAIRLLVEVWVKKIADTSLRTTLGHGIADVRKALERDVSQGGVAMNTVYRGVRNVYDSELTFTKAGAFIEYLVPYRFLRGQPA